MNLSQFSSFNPFAKPFSASSPDKTALRSPLMKGGGLKFSGANPEDRFDARPEPDPLQVLSQKTNAAREALQDALQQLRKPGVGMSARERLADRLEILALTLKPKSATAEDACLIAPTQKLKEAVQLIDNVAEHLRDVSQTPGLIALDVDRFLNPHPALEAHFTEDDDSAQQDHAREAKAAKEDDPLPGPYDPADFKQLKDEQDFWSIMQEGFGGDFVDPNADLSHLEADMTPQQRYKPILRAGLDILKDAQLAIEMSLIDGEGMSAAECGEWIERLTLAGNTVRSHTRYDNPDEITWDLRLEEMSGFMMDIADSLKAPDKNMRNINQRLTLLVQNLYQQWGLGEPLSE